MTAIENWLCTMRRSSSLQRGSRLPDRSTAPPDRQNSGHHPAAARATDAAGGAPVRAPSPRGSSG
ncbi:hypothetical protein [Actinomadura vinacea]|uniref:hypothetical protein n=1 Tax=Actinomadura vinacea TaxID=115336 RepID=UPI0031E23FC3